LIVFCAKIPPNLIHKINARRELKNKLQSMTKVATDK
jgi:hypothetical protein